MEPLPDARIDQTLDAVISAHVGVVSGGDRRERDPAASERSLRSPSSQFPRSQF